MEKPTIHISSSRGYQIASIIVLIIVFSVLVSNTVYYRKLQNDTSGLISHTSTVWLFWLNLIMALVAGVMMVWSMIRFFFHSSAIDAAKAYLAAEPQGAVAYIQGKGPVYNIKPGSSDIYKRTNEYGQKELCNIKTGECEVSKPIIPVDNSTLYQRAIRELPPPPSINPPKVILPPPPPPPS